MSRLQSALRAYPQGSVVTAQMAREDKAMKSAERVAADREVSLARQIQAMTSCTWSVALRAARSQSSGASR